MQVVLKVVGGKNDGREIKISVPKFIIGRGEQAHLRPSSDLISREHCCLQIGDGQVVIEDMGSRNGTIVNEEKLSGPHVAKVGDILKVGRLQFEVLIDHAQAGVKKAKVKSVAEVAQRSAGANNGDGNLEDSITDWLAEPGIAPKKEIAETRQFRLDETTQMFPANGASDETTNEKETTKPVNGHSKSKETASDEDSSSGLKKKKKEVLKLPPKPKFSSDTSTSAADDVLKKFFNRR